jgi:hypothetical protein
VLVQFPKLLTIQLILQKLADRPRMLMYLPDNPATHVTRDYLFTVVNTLD